MMVFMHERLASDDKPAVSANGGPVFTAHDAVVEALNNYVRTALLTDPDVIEHLLALDELRREWKLSRNHGKMREALIGDDLVLVAADHSEQRRYERALEASPLVRRGVFSAGGLDHQVSVIRGRRDIEARTGVECWRGLIPVNDQGAGLGRQKARKADRRSRDALELAIAAVVREINPRCEPRALAEAHPGTVRTNLHRLRKLATL
jgi:hypothetical protein